MTLGIHDIVIINSRVLLLRTLQTYDYDEFRKLTKIKIDKSEFMKDYVKNENIFVKVLVNVLDFKFAAISMYEKGKLTKVIFNKDYDHENVLKYLANINREL